MLMLLSLASCREQAPAVTPRTERIAVAPDQRGFVCVPSGRVFHPWGNNYGNKGRLIEDYWESDWATVERDFREMKRMGANTVRVHLQFCKFMVNPEKLDADSLGRLGQLLALAEQTGLYLDLTGLGCYRASDVPAWYDQLPESERWHAQARFWEGVAAKCADSPAVFCYDLINEPVIATGKRKPRDWYSGALGDYNFIQFINLDPAGRTSEKIALSWISEMTRAIHKHLITAGLLPFDPGRTAKLLFDGGTYNFSGSFDTSGNAVKMIAAKGGSVTLTMALDWTSGQINGAVSGSGWSSPLYAEAASRTSVSGDYTLLLEPESTNATVGDGYLLLTNHLGDAVFSGALADGSSISVSSKVGRLGDVPLFQNLYGKAGLVLGWLTFSNGTVEATPLTWIKASETGFTNSLSVAASGWTNPPANLLTDGVLVISGDGLDLTNIVSIEGDKIIQQPGSVTNSLAGTINARTGLMTITFGNGAGKATTTAHGVFLEDSASAGGYFLIKTNAGAFVLGH